MAQLRRDYQEYMDRNTEIVVVGPDNRKAFENYFKQHELPFVGIPDPKHQVLKTYGQQVKIFKFGRMPAQAIINQEGMVRYIHYGDEMSDIPANADILKLLDEMEAAQA